MFDYIESLANVCVQHQIQHREPLAKPENARTFQSTTSGTDVGVQVSCDLTHYGGNTLRTNWMQAYGTRG